MSGLSDYERLIQKNRPPKQPPPSPEMELDSLVSLLQERQRVGRPDPTRGKPDRIEALRQLAVSELIPAFVELKEKYSPSGVFMEMDASNFLEGGREVRLEFKVGEYRAQLLGTVTTEAIAFHETRYAPDLHGELASGPMLRIRNLDAQGFREFICERLAILLRTAIRRR